MASFVSKNVAEEKMDAMRKFERRRMFWKLLPAAEALVVLLLLLSWLMNVFSVGEYLQRIISAGFPGGILTFGAVNVLIALIFSLSNRQKLTEPDLYFEYISSSSSSVAAASSGWSSSPVVTAGEEEKTSLENPKKDLISIPLESTLSVQESQPPRREMVRAVSSVGDTAQVIRRKREMTSLPSAAGESSTNHDDQVYRRSRSERLDRRGGFRRSVKELSDIDDLSSDEFRSTVEMFIARKKNMLLKDRMKP